MGNSCNSSEIYRKRNSSLYQKSVLNTNINDRSKDIFSDIIIHNGAILDITCYSTRILSCGDDNKIAIIDYSQLGSTPSYLMGHTKSVSKVLCNNSYVFSASRDLSIKLWNITNNNCQKSFNGIHTLNITGLAINKHRTNLFYSGSRDTSVKTWDIETSQCIYHTCINRNIVTNLQCHPLPENQNLIYQASEDLCIRIWDQRTSNNSPPAQIISGYVYFPISMAFHSDGNLFATGCKGFDSLGSTIKLWDLRNTSSTINEYIGHSFDVVGCQFSSIDPNILISASKDGCILAWKTIQDTIPSIPNIPNNNQYNALVNTGKLITSLSTIDADTTTTDKSTFALGAMDGSITICNFDNNNNNNNNNSDNNKSTINVLNTSGTTTTTYDDDDNNNNNNTSL